MDEGQAAFERNRFSCMQPAPIALDHAGQPEYQRIKKMRRARSERKRYPGVGEYRRAMRETIGSARIRKSQPMKSAAVEFIDLVWHSRYLFEVSNRASR